MTEAKGELFAARSRSRSASLGILVTLLVVAAVCAVYACHAMRQTPFMAGPDRVTICGRDFSGPGPVIHRQQLLQQQDSRIGTVLTWQGRREIWGRHVTIAGVPGCGTGVFLRVSEDTFRGYGLLGGP